MSTPDLRVAVCTWFGTGLLPKAPGTWASIVAGFMALAFLMSAPPETWRLTLFISVAVTTLAGIACAPAAIRAFGVADPAPVVIDEVAGVWLALACLPQHVLSHPLSAVLVATALFRVFDIAKPWPLDWCERLPAGWGIMADDLAAGTLAGFLAAVTVG